jgi:hypothetical protein
VWTDALDVEAVERRTRDATPAAARTTASMPVAPSSVSGARANGSRMTTDAPRTLQMVREPEPPTTTAAHRALEPAEPVEVECDGEVPRVVTWRGHRIAVSRPIGPERLSGDWWDDGYRRDYWRCESLAGEFVVYLDRADDAWRLQGWVD